MKQKLIIPFFILLALPGISVGQTVPDLGTNASTFILFTAPGALTNVGASVVYGDVGTNNIGEYAGFTPGTVLKGTSHINDEVSVDAGNELQAAYTDFATNTECEEALSITLTGPLTLLANTYCTGGATSITGDITLDANDDPDAVFLFKIGGALSLAASARIILTGGAKISNVYFQVDGAVDIGTGAVFRGTVVADGAIELLGNSTLYGKALSISGAIHLHDNIVASSESALPVTLVSFNVIRGENNSVHLKWTTTAETNSARFEIENSLTGKDWQMIGTINAHGESTQQLSYTYSTGALGNGINFFRLRMVDQDETFAYSRIRSVEFYVKERTIMYPNPAVDKLTLDVDDISRVEWIQLHDLNGRILYDQRKSDSSNLATSIDIKTFPAGMYVVRITRAAGTVAYVKIVKR
jgi:hypothetical protein